jgi:glutamyl-tRNA synthetase
VPVDPEKIFVDALDFSKMEGDVVRLKDIYNVSLGRESAYAGDDVVAGMPKIQWVSEPKVESRVIMPDGSAVRGFSDQGVGEIESGSIVQFVRFGFCRLDARDGPVAFFRYAHS